MKPSKKTFIILVVVAVAAFLIWRKRKGTAVGTPVETSEPGPSDDVSLDYILSHIEFTSAERNKIEAVRKALDNNNIWRQSIAAKAYNAGVGFDQQLVCEAMWLLYNNDKAITSSRCYELCQKVKKI